MAKRKNAPKKQKEENKEAQAPKAQAPEVKKEKSKKAKSFYKKGGGTMRVGSTHYGEGEKLPFKSKKDIPNAFKDQVEER